MGNARSVFLMQCFFLVGIFPAFAQNDSERHGIRWGAAPISNYTTDKGLTLGAYTQRFNYGDPGKLPFESLLTIQGRSSTRAQSDALIEYETTQAGPRGDQRLVLSLSGLRNDNSRYYGLGEDTPFSAEKEDKGHYFFLQRFYQINTSLRTRMPAGFELETGLSFSQFSNRSNQPDSKFAEDFGPSPEEGVYAQIKLGAVWEKRNFEFIPYDGYYFSSAVHLAPGAGTERGRDPWARLDLDARRYDPILEHRRLWFASQVKFSTSTSNAPLQEKSRLGSFETLRGLPLNRFVASYSVSARGELRSVILRETVFHLPLKGGMGLFLDTGKAFNDLDRIGAAPPQWAWGLSFFASYFTDDFLGTADFGFSKETTCVYFRVGHAF